jgi:hypothetical protein
MNPAAVSQKSVLSNLLKVLKAQREIRKMQTGWEVFCEKANWQYGYFVTWVFNLFNIKFADMKKFLLLMLLSFSIAATYAAGDGTWTGYISDSHCGAKGNNDAHAACAKKCVKEGYAPVFVVGDKVYTINDPKKVSKFIGDKVTITGTINGDAIAIDKISK